MNNNTIHHENARVPKTVIAKIENILNSSGVDVSLYKTYYAICDSAHKGISEHMFRIIDYTSKLCTYTSDVYLIQLFPIDSNSKLIDISYLVYLTEKVVKKGIWNADMLDTIRCGIVNKEEEQPMINDEGEVSLPNIRVVYELEFEEDDVNWGEDYAKLVVISLPGHTKFNEPNIKREVAIKCLSLFDLRTVYEHSEEYLYQHTELAREEAVAIQNKYLEDIVNKMKITYVGEIKLINSYPDKDKDIVVLLSSNKGS